MPIRLGSNDYFKYTHTKTQNVNTIGNGLEGFDKFAAKVSKIFRKYFVCGMDKADWKKRVSDRVDTLTAKSLKLQVTYNTSIDAHVNGIIEEVQQEAFNSFIKGIPALKAKVTQLKGYDQVAKHPELLKVLNAIEANKKLEACVALGNLQSTLTGIVPIVGEEADPFYAKLEELKKDLANKNSDENKFIAGNLANLIKALDIWTPSAFKPLANATENQKNIALVAYDNDLQKKVLEKWGPRSKAIENLLSAQGLNQANTIPLAIIWADQMKLQKVSLIKALPVISTKYEFKKHGFFQDRVDEANKISKAQKKELRKLDISFANFLADKTTDLWTPLATGLKKAKSDTFIKNEKSLQDTIKDLNKYTDEESLQVLEANKAIYEKNKEIFKKFWNLDDLDKEIGKEQAKIGKITKKINKEYTKKREDKLAALYAESADERKKINIKLITYSVKHSFATLCLAVKEPYMISEDANAAECAIAIDKANEAKAAFDSLLKEMKYLKQEKKNTFQFEELQLEGDGVTSYDFDAVQQWAEDRIKDYKAARDAAVDRSNFLTELAILETLETANAQAEAVEDDRLFLDELLLRFDRVETNDDGNCFFHAIKAGLDHLDGFDEYKAMTAEGLRVALYDYMKAHAGDYQMNIANSLSEDVVSYAQAAVDEAGILLLQKAPLLQPLYDEFRNAYQPLSSNARTALADDLQMTYLNDEIVRTYADAMANETTYVDLTEALVLKDMLNIRLGLYSPNIGGVDAGLMQGAENLPVIHIFRPRSKPHFELLVEKQAVPVVEQAAEPTTT